MSVLIGPDDGAERFTKRRFVLEPGGRIPEHRHDDIEHEQYVVSGSMTLSLDGDTETAESGDAIFIPAGVAHWYENTGDDPCVFLCTVPVTEAYQTEWLEPPADRD
jgi:quercetin dioxygenase-like cupin family protein